MLNLRLNVTTPQVFEYLMLCRDRAQGRSGGTTFCLCLARLRSGGVVAGFAPAYPRSPPRHGTRPLAKRTCHRLRPQPGFLRLAFLSLHRIYGLNCTAADATPPPETWRFGTGLLPTDKFRVTNKVLDVGKSVATYFERLPRCS